MADETGANDPASSDDAVATSDDGRVRTITINRPGALNAMNNAVFSGIRDALQAAAVDDSVAVVVITGEGRAFSAGQDLSEMLDGDGHDGAPASDIGGETHQFPSMLQTVAAFPKPLIAAVNGIGVGIGMTFLAHCDLVLMSETARLRTPFPQLGLAPEAGSSMTFASVMGWQNAAYVLMSGRWFGAAECKEMGLVWKVSAPDELMPDTMEVAAELAANPIPSLIATKQLMLGSGRAEAAMAAHHREMEAYKPLLGAPANAEAVAAFLEKREPDFASIPGI